MDSYGPLVLVGGGGHCQSVMDVLAAAGVEIAGVVHGDDEPLEPLLGHAALGRDADLGRLRASFDRALITIGQIRTPAHRERLFTLVDSLGYILPSPVSPRAHVSERASLGRGCIVMHGATVNTGAVLGDNVIVNSHALVEHHCRIGNHCHIAIGAILGGGVEVGAGTFLGAGVIVRNNVRVGAGCVVGMGARVLSDIPDGTTHY